MKYLLMFLATVVFAQKPQVESKVTSKEKEQQSSAQVAQSENDLLALKISKGTEIEIDSYDSESDTFEVLIKKEPGVGPNITTLEHLQKATAGMAQPKGASKRKSDLIGAEFTLKEDLILLEEAKFIKKEK